MALVCAVPVNTAFWKSVKRKKNAEHVVVRDAKIRRRAKKDGAAEVGLELGIRLANVPQEDVKKGRGGRKVEKDTCRNFENGRSPREGMVLFVTIAKSNEARYFECISCTVAFNFIGKA